MKNIFINPLKISLIYILIGSLWIIFSDKILLFVFRDIEIISQYQSIKGIFYIMLTGVILYLLIYFNNKKLERQQSLINESERKYRLIFDNNPLPVMIFDNKNKFFMEVNKAAVKTYGYSKDEFLSLRYVDIHEYNYASGIKENNQISLSENKEYKHLVKGGRVLFVQVVSIPIVYENRDSILLISIDITKRKESEREIAAVINELDHFVYRASHDLRGPLASIKGLTQVAMLAKEEKNSKLYISLISKTANVLDNILNMLLSISNLKKTVPSREGVNLHELVDEISVIYKNLIESVGINFDNEIPEKMTIQTDKNIIRTILQSLIESSINQYYSLENGQSKNIKVESLSQNNCIIINLFDNNISIKEDETDDVLWFYHQKNGRSKNSGLGLYIAKKGIEKLKGRIKLKNNLPDGGTVFEISLPQ